MTEWYVIDTLDVESVPVVFETGSGEVTGFLKLRGRPARATYRVRIGREVIDLPDAQRPFRWRPQDLRTWPAPLPDASVDWVAPEPPPEPPQKPAEKLSAMEWWTDPDIRLGRHDERPPHCRGQAVTPSRSPL
jgi:hypothetical protein